MRPFEQAEILLGNLEVPAFLRLLALASDLTLVVQRDGVILDLAHSHQLPAILVPAVDGWVGRPWQSLLTQDSWPKAADLMRDAEEALQWRQVNFETGGETWAALCLAVRYPETRQTVVMARDLSAQSALQQRLVQAQQAMERDYWSFRQAETRYRHLFHVAQEAISFKLYLYLQNIFCFAAIERQ